MAPPTPDCTCLDCSCPTCKCSSGWTRCGIMYPDSGLTESTKTETPSVNVAPPSVSVAPVKTVYEKSEMSSGAKNGGCKCGSNRTHATANEKETHNQPQVMV
ncbi:hypothetical protein Tsubulata_026304 [Turnera subulata]|uniref:Metallothionein-like protein n=1 Tax=Turnera subulata TaxID=218843 RepID=A0A9Q0G931_9ROSI|nr:hypothetical protein Tsubulata_026304 [Turnera subulata]